MVTSIDLTALSLDAKQQMDYGIVGSFRMSCVETRGVTEV